MLGLQRTGCVLSKEPLAGLRQDRTTPVTTSYLYLGLWGLTKKYSSWAFFQPAILQWASVDHSPIQLRYQLCIAHIRSDRSKFCPQGYAHLTSFTVSLCTVFLASLVMSLILRVCKKCCLNSWVSLRNVRASLRSQARVLSHYLPQRPRFSCVKQPRD